MRITKWFYAIARILVIAQPVGCLHAGQISGGRGATDAAATDSLVKLALAQKGHGKLRDAERTLRRVLVILGEQPEPPRARMAQILANLASVVLETGRPDLAERQLRQALADLEAAHGREHPEIGAVHYNLGLALQRQRRHPAAEAAYRESLRLFEQAYGDLHPRVAASLNGLGTLAFQRGHFEEAQAWFLRALTVTEVTMGSWHPEFARELTNLAGVHAARGRHSDAEYLLERALRIYERSLGPEHPTTGACLLQYSEVLRRTKQARRARSLEQRGKAIVARWVAENQLGSTVSAEQLRGQGRWPAGERHPRPSPMPPQWPDLVLLQGASGAGILISQ